jgi:catechol 2,3-dioxygenase-like lactoylglutathione lyase family enzyme
MSVAVPAATPGDPFQPTTRVADQVVGPLESVTLVTTDADAARRFFVDGMQMRLARDTTPLADAAAFRRRLLALPAQFNWRELVFDRPAVPEAIRIEVLVLPTTGEGAAGAEIRPGMNSRLHGGLSLGFPVADMRARERRVQRAGFGSTAGITQMYFPRSDGTQYLIEEIHFRAPENLYGLGVWRPPELLPVGPLDSRSGIGGPAYSAHIVANADTEIDFYQRVFGWEARRDMTIPSSGPNGGLGLEAGAKFRFVQMFAPGAATGYLVIMDMLDSGVANPVVPRPPNRGLAAWRFGTQKFNEVVRRAQDARVTILGGPAARIDDPAKRAMSMLTPSGLLVEVFER